MSDLPYRVIRPDGNNKVRTLIELISGSIANPLLRPLTITETVKRRCEGDCYGLDTPHVSIRTPGLIWYGCTLCGTQVLIQHSNTNDLIECGPEEQRDITEGAANKLTYRNRHREHVDNRPPMVRKREQRKEELWMEHMKEKYEDKNNGYD